MRKYFMFTVIFNILNSISGFENVTTNNTNIISIPDDINWDINVSDISYLMEPLNEFNLSYPYYKNLKFSFEESNYVIENTTIIIEDEIIFKNLVLEHFVLKDYNKTSLELNCTSNDLTIKIPVEENEIILKTEVEIITSENSTIITGNVSVIVYNLALLLNFTRNNENENFQKSNSKLVYGHYKVELKSEAKWRSLISKRLHSFLKKLEHHYIEIMENNSNISDSVSNFVSEAQKKCFDILKPKKVTSDTIILPPFIMGGFSNFKELKFENQYISENSSCSTLTIKTKQLHGLCSLSNFLDTKIDFPFSVFEFSLEDLTIRQKQSIVADSLDYFYEIVLGRLNITNVEEVLLKERTKIEEKMFEDFLKPMIENSLRKSIQSIHNVNARGEIQEKTDMKDLLMKIIEYMKTIH